MLEEELGVEPIWWEVEADRREQREIQMAADDLANAKVHYDRLVAHRTDRLNRLEATKKQQLTEMG